MRDSQGEIINVNKFNLESAISLLPSSQPHQPFITCDMEDQRRIVKGFVEEPRQPSPPDLTKRNLFLLKPEPSRVPKRLQTDSLAMGLAWLKDLSDDPAGTDEDIELDPPIHLHWNQGLGYERTKDRTFTRGLPSCLCNQFCLFICLRAITMTFTHHPSRWALQMGQTGALCHTHKLR